MTEITDLCFFCAAPGVWEGHQRLGPQLSILQLIGEEPVERGPVRVSLVACAEHDAALGDAFCEVFGSCGGTSLGPQPKDDCPDPFHSGENDGESYDVGDLGPSMQAIGFRCPTCGMETMKQVAPVPESDPAYQSAVRLLRALDAAFGECLV